MGNWVSWPLLKTFFSLKDNTVSRQRVPAAATIHHRKSQNAFIYLIITIESGSRSWKVFPYHFTHCLGGQWEHKTAQKRRMQRTRTGQTQQGAMPLLCFVWGQPRLLIISYLPLILASLEVVNYLLLDTGSVWAKVRTAIAPSFAEIRHIARVSLPSQLAPPLTSLTALCTLTSRLGHWFKGWTWEPAPRQISCDPPSTLAFTPSVARRMLGEQPELGSACHPTWAEV